MNRPTPRDAAHPPAQQFLQRGELLKRLWDLLRDESGGGRHALVHLQQGGTQRMFVADDDIRGDLLSALTRLICERDIVAASLGCGRFAFLLRNCGADEARTWVHALRHALPARTPGITIEAGSPEPSIDIVVFRPRSQSLAALLAAAGIAGPSMNQGPGTREVAFG